MLISADKRKIIFGHKDMLIGGEAAYGAITLRYIHRCGRYKFKLNGAAMTLSAMFWHYKSSTIIALIVISPFIL